MNLYKSKGIVFRSTKYSETSLILDILTREKGMRSFIISGTRSSKSKNKAAKYQHLNILDIVAYDKEDKLARIKESKIHHYYKSVPYDIIRSSIGLFLLEICKNSIKEKEPNPPLFDFIFNQLETLDGDCDLALFPILFMLHLSEYIGIRPLLNYSEECAYFDLLNGKFTSDVNEKYLSQRETSKALYEIASLKVNQSDNPKYSKDIRNKIIDDLVIYYRLHIESFQQLKTLEVLRSIF